MTLTRQGALPLIDGGDTQPGGIYGFREFTQSIDLASVAASSAVNADATVTGVAVGDIPLYVVPDPAFLAGLGVVALGPVATVNTVRIRAVNPTVAAVDAAAVAFRVGILRPT